MPKYRVTMQRSIQEETEVEVEAANAVEAFSAADKLVGTRAAERWDWQRTECIIEPVEAEKAEKAQKATTK